MKKSILLFILILAAAGTKAQSPAGIDSLSLKVSKLFGKNPLSAEEGNKNRSARLVLHLSNTDSIAAIHVKLGSSSGAADILDERYPFIANGTTFIVSNNTVYVTLGKFEPTGTYYAEVKLEYGDETVSGEVMASDE